ncbi:MIP/aquaporin family protein [Nocardioides jejuensis]|uniref:Porin n=1 Tax=Nocardioides jejuensis TaxID=2502782 RepID=A0A4R1CHH0_9ACTN|nr:aquaporin [Nocardioides jejuensis]TCJ30629.1 porin [Nocardioides jejuensis]
MARNAKYFVELIGTFLFVLVIVSAVRSGSALAPFAIGAALMVNVYAGGHVSGGHYNPAVSLAVFVRGRLAARDLVPYWAAQFAGAALAAGVAHVFYGYPKAGPAFEGHDLWAAFLAEAIFTFALCWVVLNVATARANDGNSFYGLAIGFAVATGAVAVGPVSGGVFNPAVGLGVTIAHLSAWGNLWVYVVACLLGGAVAGGLFKALNPTDA